MKYSDYEFLRERQITSEPCTCGCARGWIDDDGNLICYNPDCSKILKKGTSHQATWPTWRPRVTPADIIERMQFHEEQVSKAMRERDWFLTGATAIVVAQHELKFGVGDIVTRSDRHLWFKVEKFSIEIEDHDEVRLWAILRRVSKSDREFVKSNGQLVSTIREYARTINKSWRVIE
jgi:hypothetical protein